LPHHLWLFFLGTSTKEHLNELNTKLYKLIKKLEKKGDYDEYIQ
jgi:hypothetical protein